MQTLTCLSIAEKTGLRPYEVGYILKTLLGRKSIDNLEFVRLTCLPKSVARDFLSVIATWLEPTGHSISLSLTGMKAIEDLLNEEESQQFLRKFTDEDEMTIRSVFEKYSVFRPTPERNLDQFSATVDAQVARVRYMFELGHLQGQRILFVGDNDLTSVAVACSRVCARVAVVDVDVRVLEMIELIAALERLQIDVFWQDLRDNLQVPLPGSFDVCFTDPPYTENGIKLFISRSIQSLTPKMGRTIYLSYGYSRRSAERVLKIQQILTESGLVIESKLPDFNTYEGAQSIGSCSSLYVCNTTDMTIAQITGHFDEPLYTGEIRTAVLQPNTDKLDQHFLISHEITHTLIDLAEIQPHDSVLEIGPGLGNLTVELSEKAGQVYAVELDVRLRTYLENLVEHLGNVKLIWGNVLTEDLPKVDKIVANLPYSIIEPLIEKLKDCLFERAVLITGARFAWATNAGSGETGFGKLALLTRCYFNIDVVEIVNRTAFRPRPRVKSAIIVLRPIAKAHLASKPQLYIMRELFEQRDKILKNALREGLIRYSEVVGEVMTKREARAVISEIAEDQSILSMYLESLSNQQLQVLYEGIERWGGH